MGEILFSIIVPVYNVEQYLDECVKSLIDQDTDNYEILLVDDGSTDGSGALCDSYASEFSFIKSFHKPNGGLSSARNYGMGEAQGKYFIFVDSDDWIAKNTIGVFADIANKYSPDVIITRICETYDNETVIKNPEIAEDTVLKMDRNTGIDWICRVSQNSWPAVLKIISASLVREKNMRFEEGRYHEDLAWTCDVMINTSDYVLSGVKWYYHRMGRKGAITGSVSTKKIVDVLETASDRYKRLTSETPEIRKTISQRVQMTVFSSVNRIRKGTDVDVNAVAEVLKENEFLLEDCSKFQHRIFVVLCRILGIRNTLSLMKKL